MSEATNKVAYLVKQGCTREEALEIVVSEFEGRLIQLRKEYGIEEAITCEMDEDTTFINPVDDTSFDDTIFEGTLVNINEFSGCLAKPCWLHDREEQ